MSRKLGPMMEVARIQSEINRLFDGLLDLGSEEKPGGSWIPNADILETRESLILRVELPGVTPETLSVSVHGGNIIIRGEKASDYPSTHDLAVQETILRASKMPLDA